MTKEQYAVVNFNKVDSEKTLSKSYRAQVPELKNDIGSEDNLRIKKFIEHLNTIMDTLYETLEPRVSKPKENLKIWGNLAKQTGMILFEWLTNEHKNPIFHEQNRKKCG